MSDELNTELPPSPAPNIGKVHMVLKEIEDGLETVEAIPEHVLEWLKSKVAAIKSHL